DAGPGRLAPAHIHAHPTGLAGRGEWRDPRHRARRPDSDQSERVGPMTDTVARLAGKPWIWSFVGAGLVWLAAIAFTGGYGGGGMLTAALSLSVFTVVVGVGQMFV